jgi:hypothetical protein
LVKGTVLYWALLWVCTELELELELELEPHKLELLQAQVDCTEVEEVEVVGCMPEPVV